MMKNGVITLLLLFCMVSSTSLLAMEGLALRVKKAKKDYAGMTQKSNELLFSARLEQMSEFERTLNLLFIPENSGF